MTEDRILVRADTDLQAPRVLESGLVTAKSLAAAVDGEDVGESPWTGTIVQVGPMVRHRDVRRQVASMVHELEVEGHDIAPIELATLRRRILTLPADAFDPVSVGDRVVFSWAVGQQVMVDGERYLVLRASEVLAVLEG